MTPDLARIAQAIGECRASLQFCEGLRHDNFQVWHIERHEPVFVGTRADCLAYIDARCAEAAVRAMLPAELLVLSASAVPGRWHGGHRCDGAITVGPLGERVAIGSDIPAQDAMLAAEAVNLVRSLSAILGEAQP